MADDVDVVAEPSIVGQHAEEFITGPAGTGKTYLVKEAAAETPGTVLCATTGVASLNLGPDVTTINALLGYFNTEDLKDRYMDGRLVGRLYQLYKNGIRRLILDEVSMLGAGALTTLTRSLDELANRAEALRNNQWTPKEGKAPPAIGLTLVGDFAQLAPVKEKFAFESPEWPRYAAHTTKLTKNWRQDDQDFIDALQAARRGEGERALAFFAAYLHGETDEHYDGPTLYARNEMVDRFNGLRMDDVDGPVLTFSSDRWGKQRGEWGNPEKPKETWDIPETLRLKEGALVMILANYRETALSLYEYVNGDLGEIVAQDWWTPLWAPSNAAPRLCALVRLQRTGRVVHVQPVTRHVTRPIDSDRRKELKEQGLEHRITTDRKYELLGGITYMPLRIAYAGTVHKTQGLSLDKVQLNIRDHFFKTPGMLYVALSRARTAAGLRIVGSPRNFVERCTVDPRLKEYL